MDFSLCYNRTNNLEIIAVTRWEYYSIRGLWLAFVRVGYMESRKVEAVLLTLESIAVGLVLLWI